MILGLSLALASAFFFACDNLFARKVAHDYGLRLSLLIQYAVTAALGVAGAVASGFVPAGMDPTGWCVLAAGCAITYAGSALMMRTLGKLPLGVATSISNSYVFLAYVANVALFPASESLSVPRLLLGLAAMAGVGAFAFLRTEDDGSGKKFHFSPAAAWALLVPVCWTAYSVTMNWLIKTERMDELQTTFWMEGGTLAFAGAAMAFRPDWSGLKRAASEMRSAAGWYFGAGLTMYLGALFYNLSLGHVPANIANVVSPFSAVFAAVLGRAFLGQKITRTQAAVGSLALALLAAFSMAG